jgi:hypothetical protein
VNQLNDILHLWGRLGISQDAELFLGEIFPHTGYDIKAFPPAIKDLPAGKFLTTVIPAVSKRYSPPEPGASPLEVIPFIHR